VTEASVRSWRDALTRVRITRTRKTRRAGKTGAGEKFYHNIIDGAAAATQEVHDAIIALVIHYCMGGHEIDTDLAAVDSNGRAIPGL
jgi:hypothetical protein